jgi:hypothetical protein
MAKRKGPGETSGETPPPGAAPNPGLPDPKSVVSERVFISPKGRRFRILRTTDKDPYDPPDDQDADQTRKDQNKKDQDRKDQDKKPK